MDHLFLGQGAIAHGHQGNDPADDGQTELEEQSHPENGGGAGVGGLGHGGGVAQQRHGTGGDDRREGGDELVHQAVSTGDHRRDVAAGTIQLKVNGVGHVGGVGGGDAHVGAVEQQVQDCVNDHGRATHHADLRGVAKDEEDHQHRSDHHADVSPGDDAVLAAVFAHILGAEGRKEDGGHHADDRQDGGKAHISDQDAVEQGVDDGLAGHLLRQFVRGVGCNVALQRFVVHQHFDNIPHFQRLRLLGSQKSFGLVVRGYAQADQQGAHCGHDQRDGAGSREECLVVLAAEHGQQHYVHHHGHGHGHQIIESGGPDTESGTLGRIVGHNGGDGLSRHVGDGVANDVAHIEQNKDRQTQSFGREAGEHTVEGSRLNEIANHQQNTQLAEPGVDPVIHKGQQRVGDRVQNTGAGQDNAHRRSGDAIADAGGIAGHADERVHAHTHKAIAGVADDLPEFGAAVLDAVDFAGAEMFF